MTSRLLPQPSHDLDHDVLTGEVQTALAALADIETRFAIDQERLDRWTGPAAVKARLMEDLQRRRQAERGALMQRLADLQATMRRVLGTPRLAQLH
ncbi:MAG TPA: hypothetical protein VEA41_17970 [Salinarimonas sp.]|jgi:hypothetical protein|nr:hypothetical protein [Salinarimonas sp.]